MRWQDTFAQVRGAAYTLVHPLCFFAINATEPSPPAGSYHALQGRWFRSMATRSSPLGLLRIFALPDGFPPGLEGCRLADFHRFGGSRFWGARHSPSSSAAVTTRPNKASIRWNRNLRTNGLVWQVLTHKMLPLGALQVAVCDLAGAFRPALDVHVP